MAAPDRYAVIGHPVAHSMSPFIHSAFAVQTAQHLAYERLLSPLDGFVSTVRTFIEQGGKGLNVTLPFKVQAHALADVLTPRARSAGAVNTLKIADGRILGDNTDGAGLVTDIECNAAVALNGKRVLLLGAGGAARGVILPLLEANPAWLTIANRSLEKAERLAREFASFAALEVCGFASVQGRFDIVINATSASLGNEVPPVPAGIFGPATLAYDMMYGKQPTVFLNFAQQQGAMIRDGVGMLVEQAAESFYLWRGVRPQTAKIFAELRTTIE